MTRERHGTLIAWYKSANGEGQTGEEDKQKRELFYGENKSRHAC